MEKENEVIENLFDDITVEGGNNAFADVPPVAPVNYEEVVENPVEETVEETTSEEPTEELQEEKVEVQDNEDATDVVNNAFVDLPPVAPVSYEEVVENPVEETVEEMTPEEPTEELQEEKVEVQDNEDATDVVNNAFVDLPPVAPVSYEEVVENPVEVSVEEMTPEEPTEELQEESVEAKTEILNKEVLEHPDAKIKLNNEKEEEISKKEMDELKNIKLMDNSSLKFVLILGAILLVVIFLIPVISEYI